MLYYTLPVVMVLSVVVTKAARKKTNLEMDYVEAHHAFTRWDQGLEREGKSLLQLQKLMEKHPELHPHYDHQIGQNLLALPDIDRANLYVMRTLERTKQPYYSDYASTSLKISGGEYAEALKEANLLKETLLTVGWEDYSALFAFNLMRIAILYQELEDPTGERTAWGEIRQYGGWGGKHTAESEAVVTRPNGFEQLLHHFTLQEATLVDYIREREERLGE